MTMPLSAYHVRILSGALEIQGILARDQQGEPQWKQSSAPPLQIPLWLMSQADISNSATPPEQGFNHAIEDVSGGAGSYLYEAGRYAFGESVDCASGSVYPGPEVTTDIVNGGGALNGPIWCYARYEDRDWVGAGNRVYSWDYVNLWWSITPTNPPTPNGATKITDMINFNGALVLAFDTVDDYVYTSDGGMTWQSPTGAGQKRFKHFAINEDRTARPVLWGVNDPNVAYSTEDVTNSDAWSGGILVGSGGNTLSEHFTSVTGAPGQGLLVGKSLGWRIIDSAGNVSMVYGVDQSSSGAGLESFGWPAKVGARIYTPVKDYDIVEYQQGVVTPGFGLARWGPRVPELQAAVSCLASDETEWLYAGLAGASGYVMRGRYDHSGKWQWHGAYVKAAMTFGNRMWVSSHALATNKNAYLVMTNSQPPYLPKRALIPAAPLDTDPAARFVTTATIRFGYVFAGQPQVWKAMGQALPITRNLLQNVRQVKLSYRLDSATSFTDLATFYDSPEPSSLPATFFPPGLHCKRWELQATLTGTAATDLPILDEIVTRVYRRPPRVSTWQFTIQAETAVRMLPGQPSRLSAKQLHAQLKAAQQAITPPTLVNEYTGEIYTVDLQDITETYLRYEQGRGSPGAGAPALGITLTVLELPTIGSSSSQGFPPSPPGPVTIFHQHYYDLFNAPGGSVTLALTPLVEPEVFAARQLLIGGGVDYAWAAGGRVVTFVGAPASPVRVYYAALPS